MSAVSVVKAAHQQYCPAASILHPLKAAWRNTKFAPTDFLFIENIFNFTELWTELPADNYRDQNVMLGLRFLVLMISEIVQQWQMSSIYVIRNDEAPQ